MSMDVIAIKGARMHNLKNVSVTIPRNTLTVITGISGSGKSSLAFDTIFAEGQRRYVESLSAYARQFIAQMEKPEVDSIEGLSPAISIDQKTATRNPRSTVGTITEIHDYMRLLYAKVGRVHCTRCGRQLGKQSVSQIVQTIADLPEGTKVLLLAPLVERRKGEHLKILSTVRREGFVRMRIDGEVVTVDEEVKLNPKKAHTIEIVVDRLVIRDMAPPKEGGVNPNRSRLADSVELALRKGDGTILVVDADGGTERRFCESFVCPDHPEETVPVLEPRSFSFNSPHGACERCHGLGTILRINEVALVPNPSLTIAEGCIHPWASSAGRMDYMLALVEAVGKLHGFTVHTRWSDLTQQQRSVLLYGSPDPISLSWPSGRTPGVYSTTFEGIVGNLERRYSETDSSYVRSQIEEYMEELPCPVCEGRRLRREVLGVTVGDKNIVEATKLSIDGARTFFEGLIPPTEGKVQAQRSKNSSNATNEERGTPAQRSPEGEVGRNEQLSSYEYTIVKKVIHEIVQRLSFLQNVGLTYLTLDRSAATLSGGEAQRIRLATQIGSALQGVLYVLDEPSIGLHQRDNMRLIATLHHLRDLGNTVLVVEHDTETILASDHVIEIGPGAGKYGGEIVTQGSPREIQSHMHSITGQYLSGRKAIAIPRVRRKGTGHVLRTIGARHHNLKHLTMELPLGCFLCITGVSGSGKSSFVHGILGPELLHALNNAHVRGQDFERIEGLEHLDKATVIDQSPIGRTPRSNPATYTGVFTSIRELWSQGPEAKTRGYRPGRFSFNVKGGRCEECEGDGLKRIEMHFLPDVYVTCEACHGKRYNQETLEVTYKGKNIAEVLDMTVTEALDFFATVPQIHRKLSALADVGLGYIHLGQSATTLSGGEAQRVKLATELTRRDTGRTFYILDEPTVGLHAEDIQRLLTVLQRLVERGNTVLVIEHNLDVIKGADWIVDLGPEGGDSGGRIVAQGTPEDVSKVEASHTGQYLKRVLETQMLAKKSKRRT